MAWFAWIARFLAGAFFANAVPHFVHGISGNRFPSPFAHPAGRGLSSPTVNVLWALVNLALGYWLLRFGPISSQRLDAVLIFFAGVAAISIPLSVHFQKKEST
jgi:hypothetical protein